MLTSHTCLFARAQLSAVDMNAAWMLDPALESSGVFITEPAACELMLPLLPDVLELPDPAVLQQYLEPRAVASLAPSPLSRRASGRQNMMKQPSPQMEE